MENKVDIADLADAREAYRRAKIEIRKWQDVADAAKGKITERLGDAEIGTVDGYVVLTYKRSTRTTVDTKRLREDMGDLLAPYLRTSEVRSFELVD